MAVMDDTQCFPLELKRERQPLWHLLTFIQLPRSSRQLMLACLDRPRLDHPSLESCAPLSRQWRPKRSLCLAHKVIDLDVPPLEANFYLCYAIAYPGGENEAG